MMLAHLHKKLPFLIKINIYQIGRILEYKIEKVNENELCNEDTTLLRKEKK